MVTSAAARSSLIRSPLIPCAASPSFQLVAVCVAQSSTDMPFAVASDSFTQGRKAAAERSGNVSARLPMSPFGSRASTGMPASSASSSMTIPRPVLPDPVIPTITPCMVRSLESSVNFSRSGFPLGSTAVPRNNAPFPAMDRV
jgi:hypothetical protein